MTPQGAQYAAGRNGCLATKGLPHGWLLRGTWRYLSTQASYEDALTQAIVAMAAEYGRYGYRHITAMLKEAGLSVGKDRVHRTRCREGLKVPKASIAERQIIA